MTILVPAAAMPRMIVLDRPGRGRVEAGGRLVEKQHLGGVAPRRGPAPAAAARRRTAAGPGVRRSRPGPTRGQRRLGPRRRPARGTPARRQRVARHWRAAERRSSTGRWNTRACGCACSARVIAAPAHVPASGASSPWQSRSSTDLAGAVRADRSWSRGPASRVERHAVQDRRSPPASKRTPSSAAAAASAAPAPRRIAPQALRQRIDARARSPISTSPSASASGRSPLLVSSAIAVVMTRVKPSMLPPTIITAPTSAAARPKPASSAVSSEKRPSHSRVGTRLPGPGAAASVSCSAIFLPHVLDHLARQRSEDRR